MQFQEVFSNIFYCSAMQLLYLVISFMPLAKNPRTRKATGKNILPGILEIFKSMLLGMVDLAFVRPSFSDTAVGSFIHVRPPCIGQSPMRSLSQSLQTRSTKNVSCKV